MMTDIGKTPDNIEKVTTDNVRKPYFTPCLESLGDLRTTTLGGSPGFPDPSSGERSSL